MTFRIHEYKEFRRKDTIAVIGFPSVGLASSIAANFLARTLELEIIGGISSEDFPPYTVIQSGIPLPPVRMYAGDRKCEECGDGMSCDGLIVVTSEFMPKIEQHHQLAVAFLDWFEKNNVGTVICLEGIPQFEPEVTQILGVGSTAEANAIMDKYSIERLEDSLVRGTSGVMLYEGAMRKMNVLAILAPARADMPDPRGAAKLMEPLGRMLPELKIDPEPLYKEAEEAEKRMGVQHMGNIKNKDILYG